MKRPRRPFPEFMRPNMSRPRTPRRFRLGFVTVLTAIVPAALLPLQAADASQIAPAATGSIRGRVQNIASGQYLNNARVTVQGTDHGPELRDPRPA